MRKPNSTNENKNNYFLYNDNEHKESWLFALARSLGDGWWRPYMLYEGMSKSVEANNICVECVL